MQPTKIQVLAQYKCTQGLSIHQPEAAYQQTCSNRAAVAGSAVLESVAELLALPSMYLISTASNFSRSAIPAMAAAELAPSVSTPTPF